MPAGKEQPMRARSLGRWVARLVAVAAVGAGSMLGVVGAAAAVDSGSPGGAADLATSESASDGDESTDSWEWN
jgi:hypothetical protein